MGPSTYSYVIAFISINAPYYCKVKCGQWLRSCASNDALIIMALTITIFISLIVITFAS